MGVSISCSPSLLHHADFWLRNSNKITAKGGLNLADWLQSNSWTVSVGKMPTAWTSSVPTDRKPYEYLAENPWALKLAQAHMRINWDKKPIFLDALDFGSRFEQDTTSSTVLFVDVGGSTGSVSLALRQRCPDLPGRVLLQDRPEVVEQVKAQLLSSAGIEAEVYDIFTPQPVKGTLAQPLLGLVVVMEQDVSADIGSSAV